MTDIPACLAHLPRWGEYPIPFTTPESKAGEKPHFRTTDPNKHNMCVRFFLCGACGKHIPQPPYYFVLGPMCVELRAVFGTPMHEDCGRAAMRLCPWISRAYPERKRGQGEPIEGILQDALPPKPARLALAAVPRFDTITNPESGLLYVTLPAAGTYATEWWAYVDGTLVPETTGQAARGIVGGLSAAATAATK